MTMASPSASFLVYGTGACPMLICSGFGQRSGAFALVGIFLLSMVDCPFWPSSWYMGSHGWAWLYLCSLHITLESIRHCLGTCVIAHMVWWACSLLLTWVGVSQTSWLGELFLDWCICEGNIWFLRGRMMIRCSTEMESWSLWKWQEREILFKIKIIETKCMQEIRMPKLHPQMQEMNGSHKFAYKITCTR